MSKKKPESLTERQHFLLYEYKFTWWKLTSKKDAQHNQDQRYKLADLTRDYWRIKDRILVLVYMLTCYILLLGLTHTVRFLFSGRLPESFFFFNRHVANPINYIWPFFCLWLSVPYYREKFLRKRLQEEWKDVPVIGEDGEPISKVEEQTHA